MSPQSFFVSPSLLPGQLSELSRTVSQQRASLVEWENKGRDMLKRVEDADKMVQTYKVHPLSQLNTISRIRVATVRLTGWD